MDQYIVSARKYRPSTFKSVVGQKVLTATLKNAISTGRLAHSYLFCGSRGVGKTSCARIFAKTINCEHPTVDGEACNECESCKAFNNGNSLNIIELDAASNNGVDDIRAIVEQVQIPPSTGKYRVFIVDEVHMLSAAAFNAFLKTLEEPPHYVIFILATTEKHKILPTILSRCQIYDFSRITVSDMVDHLQYVANQEGFSAEKSALGVIARKADGAMRDALSIFDQVAASTRGNITYQATIDNLNVLGHSYYNHLLEDFLSGDVMDAWLTYKEIRDRGFDSHFFINGMADYMRDLMVARSPQTLCLLETDDEARQAIAAEAVKVHPEFLFRAMNLLNEADLNYRTAANKQFLTELTLAKICQIMKPLPQAETTQPLKTIHATSPQPAPASAPAVAPQTVASGPKPQETVSKPVPQAPKIEVARAKTTRSARATVPINKPKQPSQAAESNDDPGPQSHRNNEFTARQLTEAWMQVADHYNKDMVIERTMKTRQPQLISGTNYKVVVVNDLEEQKLQQVMPEIMKFLRNALSNDSLSITIEVHEGEPSPHTWPESKVLEHFRNSIPGMEQMIQDLKLTLA